jgi:hypothetical protein
MEAPGAVTYGRRSSEHRAQIVAKVISLQVTKRFNKTGILPPSLS